MKDNIKNKTNIEIVTDVYDTWIDTQVSFYNDEWEIVASVNISKYKIEYDHQLGWMVVVPGMAIFYGDSIVFTTNDYHSDRMVA